MFSLVGLLVIACLGAGFIFGRGTRRDSAVVAVETGPVGVDVPRAKRSVLLRRIIFWGGAFVILAGFSLLLVEPAAASLTDTMRDSFSNALSDFVNSIMTDQTNTVYQWTWMMFLAFSFFLVVREVIIFMADGLNPASHFEAIVFFFATLTLMAGYDAFTDAIWGIGVGLSNGYQYALVGHTDNFFLSNWIDKSVAAISFEDVGFLDSMRLIAYYLQWQITSFFLEFAAWVAATWAQFGYSLSKVIGIVFIPFLLLPGTRPLFDSWIKFFLGFVILLIMLKATMVVAAITVKGVLGTLGVTWTTDFGEPAGIVEVAKNDFYILVDASLMLFLSALFVLSSFVFAAVLAGGAGSVSGALGSVSKQAIRKMKGGVR